VICLKFGISAGHNNPPVNTGANGCGYLEDNLTREITDKILSKLRILGYEAIDCTPESASSLTDSLWQRCNIANINNVDLYIEIHFNAFNGSAKGSEVLCNPNNSLGVEYAQKILNGLVECGWSDRGVKDGNWLYVIKHTNMTGILVEICFIDNQDDIDKLNAELVANKIVKTLTGQEVVEEKYYVKTQQFDGEFVEIINLYKKYFNCDRFYATGIGTNSVYFSTQYLDKSVCDNIVESMKNDGLYAEVIQE
jgi:hypothetical protein